jgi:penicillin-binding protein 2
MLNQKQEIPAGKLSAIQYVIVAILVILVAGLWRLQVVGKNNYRAMAQANRVRKVPILAPRGRLFDREGRLIVDNYPSVSCFLVHEHGRDLDADIPQVAQALNMSVADVQSAIHKFGISSRYKPIPLKLDLTPDEQAYIEAHSDELPELELIDEERRLYPRDGFMAHLIGYVGEVSEDMLQTPRYAYYEPGDVVGRSGVEETYDQLLRGQDGSHDVLVDSHGREVGVLGNEPAVPGQDLRLTIDLDVQRAAETALGNRDGSIVALDPHTGEVLAMVSRPTFDPNQFAVKIGRKDWASLITNQDHPLLNKAIQAQLAPGSTFKIIMSLAGLEEGVAQNLKVDCQGGATFYGRFYACDAHHGNVNIQNALPYSCDTYYYTLAQRLGIDRIAYWANKAGIGVRTGIDLPDEAKGIMPSTEWQMRNYHEKWYAGETISVGIGQGAVAVTPIQLARAIGGIASGGDFKRPHVVFPGETPAQFHQALLESFSGSGNVNIPIAPSIWQNITDGMAETTDPNCAFCTAHASHLQGIDFAGKTGTAQVVNHSFGAKIVSSNKYERANAWFVGMAPRRNPDIVVVVLWEHGGWGAGSAHIAAQVIETYVDKERRLEHNLQAPQPPAVEVGAVWSAPGEQDGRLKGAKPSVEKVDTPVGPGEKTAPIVPGGKPTAALDAGHFWLPVRPWKPTQPVAPNIGATAAALPSDVADYLAGAQ